MNTRDSDKKSAAGPWSGDVLPQISPLYPQPPFEYRDCWTMAVWFRTDPQAVARYIPRPLVADPDGTMFCMVSRMWASGFGHFNELVLGAAAKYEGRTVNHCLYIILDNDIPIGAGREIWGFPKKYGRVQVSEQAEVVAGIGERRGIVICEAAMAASSVIEPEELPGGAEYTNLKLVPSIKLGARPEVMQLTSTTVSNVNVKTAYKGAATLKLNASPVDHIHEIPVQQVIGGYHYKYDFTLGGGDVLHDYLKS